MKEKEAQHCLFRMFKNSGNRSGRTIAFWRRRRVKKRKSCLKRRTAHGLRSIPRHVNSKQGVTKAPQANKQGKGWPYLCLVVEQQPRNPF